MNADTPAVASVAAAFAAGSAVQLADVEAHPLERLAHVSWRLVNLPALLADFAQQPLCKDHIEGRADQIRLDAHVHKPRYGGTSVVCVQRAEDQVAGQRGLNGSARRFFIAHL